MLFEVCDYQLFSLELYWFITSVIIQISKMSFSTCIPPFCTDLIMRTEYLELEDSATLQALKTALNQQKLRNKWLQYLISRRPGKGPCTSPMCWVPNPTAEATRSCPDMESFWFLFHFTGDILCVCVCSDPKGWNLPVNQRRVFWVFWLDLWPLLLQVSPVLTNYLLSSIRVTPRITCHLLLGLTTLEGPPPTQFKFWQRLYFLHSWMSPNVQAFWDSIFGIFKRY